MKITSYVGVSIKPKVCLPYSSAVATEHQYRMDFE